MNIFLREWKANFKALLIWCAVQYFIIMVGMVKYSGFAGSNVDVSSLMSQFPKGLQAVFGIGAVDPSTIMGYYSIFFLYFMLLAAIHAAMLGAVLIAKEEREHAADFLYAKPVRRSRVVTAKLIAGLSNILVFNLVTFIASVFYIGQYNNGDSLADKVFVMMFALLLLQIVFLTLGTAMGALLKTAKLASSAVTFLLLSAFFLSIGIDMNENIEFLRYITPFQYFDAKQLLFGGSYPLSSLILCAVLTSIFTYITYARLGRRDLAV